MIEDRTDPYKLTVIALALFAAVLFAYPVLRVGTVLEIDYNEGWNAWLQTQAMAGKPLYSTINPMFLNNYPPLSFYLVGALSGLVGDVVLTGRLLSLVAVVVIAASAASVARSAGARPLDALLSGSAALAMLSGFATDYVGINDPQLLAQGFLCAGFALYVSHRHGVARLPVVVLLFAAGLLCKHNVLALPLVTTAHILWRGSNRERAIYFGCGAVLAAASVAVIEARFGTDFFRNMLASRQYDPARGILLTTEMLDMLQVPLAVIGLYYLLGQGGRVGTKVGAYLGLSLALAAGFSGGAGVDINVFFDPLIACAMGIGPAIAWLRARPGCSPRTCAALALLVHAGLIFHAPIDLGRFAVDMTGGMKEREALFRQDIDWLKARPGKAYCESMLLCFRAGKDIWIDSYAAAQAMTNGRMPAEALTGMLDRHEVGVVQVSSRRTRHDDDAEGGQSMPPRFINVADEVFDALDRSYKVERVGLSGRFYVPE